MYVFVPEETIEYPRPTVTLTWSAMFACVYCSINSCPCENTHGSPFCLLYVCRIGLCARDYARVMVGMVLT